MRLIIVEGLFDKVGFNPRICKRCDLDEGKGANGTLSVSIHASVKDATLFQSQICKTVGCFNPRICKRCD